MSEFTPPPSDSSKPQQELITGIPDHLLQPSTTNETPQMPFFDYPVPSGDEEDPDGLWSYTQAIRGRSGEMYGGRLLIGRDTPIDGGVYYGTYGGEAIVVDTEKYPNQYNKLLGEVLEKSRDQQGRVMRSKILQAVFDTVSQHMTYSKEGVNQLLSELGKGAFKNGTKVNLEHFIEDGVGVCRHQALVAGVLLERLKKVGHIRGEVSVDRSMQWNPKGEKDGHAWVRYTGSTGDVMILDIAQGYFGFLEDVSDRGGWNYLRPEEQKQLTSKAAGETAVRSASQKSI